MLKAVDFYYFSPTGGTKKAGDILTRAMAETVYVHNLAEKTVSAPVSDVVIAAAPVFAGRIPSVAGERLARLQGKGKKAVTLAVYGVRAYEDALLELNDVMEGGGFEVIASAALVAQHSMVPEVGTGRPDAADADEIQRFAGRIENALQAGKTGGVSVPGNRPYKDGMKVAAPPLSLENCVGCGECARACPTEAIETTEEGVKTEIGKCILCLACTAHCPLKARILPPPVQEGIRQKLSVFRDVRRENEFFE